MKRIVLMVVASVFVNTVKSVPVEPKQVNLALETVLRFDNKDRASDLAVIDKVQNVLEKIKNAVQNRNGRRSNTQDIKRDPTQEIKFSDFILKAAKILRKYNDGDLEDAFAVIDDESRRYIDRDSKLQELFGNNIRRFMTDQLDNVKNMPGNALRRHLETAIFALENKELTGTKNNMLDIGNTLYTGASDKFKTALKKLERLRRSNAVTLSQVLRDTLKSLVFDHYSNLNDNVKGELINIVRHYWRAFSSDNNSKNNGKSTASAVTPFSHKKKAKPANKQASLAQKRYKISEISSSVHRSVKQHNTGHKSKEESKEEEKHKQKKGKTVFKLHYSLESESSLENGDESAGSDSSDSDRSEMLFGGQVRSIHVKGDTSSHEVSEQSDNTKEIQNTREIVIQHSNVIDVGLSRKVPGRINVSFVSDERSRPDDLRRSEGVVNGRRGFTVFPATVSHEGISIESFEGDDSEDKHSAKRKNMRKSNINTTSELVINATDPGNVQKLIENIEKQIEDVKEQVEYVKKMKMGAGEELVTPKFKSVASAESSSTPKNITTLNPNSASIEKDNEAFLTDSSAEKETSANKTTDKDSVKFRSQDDTQSKRGSSEKEIKRNYTQDTSNESKANVMSINTSIINGTDNNVEDASANVKDDKSNLNKSKLNNNEAKDKNTNNEKDDADLSDGKEINDKDHTNVTEVDKTNEEDFSNTITPLNLDTSTKNVEDEMNEESSKDLGL